MPGLPLLGRLGVPAVPVRLSGDREEALGGSGFGGEHEHGLLACPGVDLQDGGSQPHPVPNVALGTRYGRSVSSPGGRSITSSTRSGFGLDAPQTRVFMTMASVAVAVGPSSSRVRSWFRPGAA